MAAPMPCRRLAPVTSATRPVRSDPLLGIVIDAPTPLLPDSVTEMHDGMWAAERLDPGAHPCEGCYTSIREASEEEFWMRQPGFTASGFLIFAILLLAGITGAPPAAARQIATPAAGTPAVIEI